MQCPTLRHKISVVNTDNVGHNGQVLQRHLQTLLRDDPAALQFLKDHVVILDSMVDRITSQRPDSSGS